METREFVCVVEGLHATGTVTGHVREIHDYEVKFELGTEGSAARCFEFTMIMVSTPPLYVVNMITQVLKSAKVHVYVDPVREHAEICFETALRAAANLYNQGRDRLLLSKESI